MKTTLFLSSVLACLFLLSAAVAPAQQVPRRAPEFVIHMPDGSQRLLSSFKGKVVMMEFLLTTCPHCQKTSQLATRLEKEYGPKGFQPIGVAIDPMAKMLVPDFVRTYGATYPVGFADRDSVMDFLQISPMMRMLVPQVVFIDRTGTIRAYYPGGDAFFNNEEKNMRAEIEKLLNERAAPAKPGARKTS
jgi:thiol-disulfide isomerase/thioredoxin